MANGRVLSFQKRRWRALLAVTVAVLVLMMTACGGKSGDGGKEASHSDHAQHHAPNGDQQETTAGKDKLPTFLDGLQAEIVQTYKLAAENAELLQWIPCYCGCGRSAGHKSNRNCFIKEIKPDGSIVWDDHGTRCGVCLSIAQGAAALHKEGKSVKEIRAAVDQAFGTGEYAQPTPTPQPEA